MKKLPYPMRPNQSAIYREPPSDAAKELSGYGFSEPLTLLLGMTLSGGLTNRTLFSLLKDILPYADPHDRRIIEKMLCAEKLSSLQGSAPGQIPSCPLTSRERLAGMLHALKRYSNKQTSDRFSMLERFIAMQRKVENSKGDLMPLVMEMMGADSEGLMKIMSMMKNM